MTTSLEVVLPVLNEEKSLEASTRKLHSFLSDGFASYEWRILIAENGSTDSTPQIAARLSETMANVGVVNLGVRGRGRAIRKGWLESRADILAYMDIDLSTDLASLVDAVEAIELHRYDIAVGSRLLKGSRVIGRPFHREVMSRAYSMTFRLLYLTRFRDAQCGFKAISRETASAILPVVEDMGWFFDTELLIVAEKNGYRIKEVPVTWTDDPDTRVRIIPTIMGDLKGLLRLKLGGLAKASKALAASAGNPHGE